MPAVRAGGMPTLAWACIQLAKLGNSMTEGSDWLPATHITAGLWETGAKVGVCGYLEF